MLICGNESVPNGTLSVYAETRDGTLICESARIGDGAGIRKAYITVARRVKRHDEACSSQPVQGGVYVDCMASSSSILERTA